MKFIVDTKDAEMWGLSANELLVLSALRRFCHKTGNWQGSYAKLAKYIGYGSRTAIFDTTRNLIAKNLISFEIRTKTFEIRTDLERKEAKEVVYI